MHPKVEDVMIVNNKVLVDKLNPFSGKKYIFKYIFKYICSDINIISIIIIL